MLRDPASHNIWPNIMLFTLQGGRIDDICLGTPFNLSGTWEGVMGGIVSGEYDICPLQWLWTVPRARVLSFSTFTSLRNVLIYIPQNPAVDFWLFFRPFTKEVWAFLVTTIVITVTGLMVHRKMLSQEEDMSEGSTSHRILSSVACYSFLFVNAFYGAALLTFFTFPAMDPFNRLGNFPCILTITRYITGWEMIRLLMQLNPPPSLYRYRQEGGRRENATAPTLHVPSE